MGGLGAGRREDGHADPVLGPQRSVLICHLRPARRKARGAAVAEALGLLRDLEPVALAGGPLAEQGGVFWLVLSPAALQPTLARLPRLGYTRAVDLLEPAGEGRSGRGRAADPARRLARWRGATYALVRVYEEDAALLRERAPDRRVFLLETGWGEVRPVAGYRGDGGVLSRRGLPVCDARLLVNLVGPPTGGALLDPFAGVGGIVIEALAAGWPVASTDRDRVLRHGLAGLGARHVVADARRLPFDAGCFDAVATEPPYDAGAGELVVGALREMARVLRGGGRLAVLCAARQAEGLRREGAALGLTPFLDAPIDRKGLAVAALAWHKGGR
jgi:SAM-dependent methyltransferase